MMRIATAAIALAAFTLPVNDAEAQGRCFSAEHVAKQLAEKYDEELFSYGVHSNGTIVQVYRSADGSTWTIVATSPQGVSCFLASGEHWERLPIEPDGPRT